MKNSATLADAHCTRDLCKMLHEYDVIYSAEIILMASRWFSFFFISAFNQLTKQLFSSFCQSFIVFLSTQCTHLRLNIHILCFHGLTVSTDLSSDKTELISNFLHIYISILYFISVSLYTVVFLPAFYYHCINISSSFHFHFYFYF